MLIWMFIKSPLDAIYAIIWKYMTCWTESKFSCSINSQKSYPPIESGRNINWFSSILRVVTFFNEPIEERNNTQFSKSELEANRPTVNGAHIITFEMNHTELP